MMKFCCYKKAFLSLALLMGIIFSCTGQSKLPHYPDSLFSTYYHQKVAQFKLLPQESGKIIFLGNSITDFGSWSELFQDAKIINRGISGDITAGVLNRLGEVIGRNPKKVFLLIGTNDLARGLQPDSILKNIYRIASLIHEYSPATRLYIQSIFPVNKKFGMFASHTNKAEQIKYINRHLSENAQRDGYTFIDVYDVLKDENDDLNPEYTNDGLHLLGRGYMVWKHLLFPYVYDLSPDPSVIPEPQNVSLQKGSLPLYLSPDILIKDKDLAPIAEKLREELNRNGLVSRVITKATSGKPLIELQLGKVETPAFQDEAYHLSVSDAQIVITGNTPHGVFNGVQTLYQLMRDYVFVQGVEITDWPAFSWRGYMIDVGRNFQSVEQIKQQLDIMSRYKMNVFHFHLTENVAWRLQIKQYPQLTKGAFMTRNQGQYYTVEQMQELIRYAKERFITLVPEIDMPGHSAAFTRAMGVEMQSEEGLEIVKNILTEVSETYDVPYIHIGADEVKITNENFIPEVVALLHKQRKETIGWAPGGNYDDRTIRQLWTSEGPEKKGQSAQTIRYIDSRALYLNHMDPLSGVVSLFDRKIGDIDQGNQSILGGEICVWQDDRAKDEKDMLAMNFVYPAMLAFSERSWKGGGYDGVVTDMGINTDQRYQEFAGFEQRLLDQKKLFFTGKPFPYQRQTDIRWKLFGPFDNDGDLSKIFWPEQQPEKLETAQPDLIRNGGTIWLRHFFAPVVSGAIENPKENTTWYAYRQIYSPVDTTADFWISFYNPSRSHAVMTPEVGEWGRKSRVWIADQEIAPPKWTYPGRDNDTWEDPLVDESYEYRPPTRVELKKGWNTILVKAPAGSFAGKSWQHPVKWMFTVVEVK